jgi:hypothetical protein
MLRMSGKKNVVKEHPVMSQIDLVKAHYQKLDRALKKRDEKVKSKINKEASKRIV